MWKKLNQVKYIEKIMAFRELTLYETQHIIYCLMCVSNYNTSFAEDNFLILQPGLRNQGKFFEGNRPEEWLGDNQETVERIVRNGQGFQGWSNAKDSIWK